MGKDYHLTHLFELDRLLCLKLLEGGGESLFNRLNPSSLWQFDEATNDIKQISFFTPESFSFLCPWSSYQSTASPKPVLPADTPSLFESHLPQKHMIYITTGANTPARNAHKNVKIDAFWNKTRSFRHPRNGNGEIIEGG